MRYKKLSFATVLISGALHLSTFAQDAEVKEPAVKEADSGNGASSTTSPTEVVGDTNESIAEKRLAEVAQKLSIKEQEQRIKSKSLVELGKKKYQDLEYESSESFFKKALEAHPENKEAAEWLIKVQTEGGKTADNRHVNIQNARDLESVRVQTYRAEADNQLAKARALINDSMNLVDGAAKDDQLAALAEAEKSLVAAWKIYQNLLEQLALRRNFPGFDARSYQEKAEGGKKDVSNLLDQLQIRRKKIDQQLAIDKAKEENDRNKKYFEDKIREQLISAEHQLNMKNYDAAERIARDVLREDPNNSKALSIKKRARSKRHKNFDKVVPKILEDNIKEGNQQINEYEIPFQDIVVYPAEWEDFIMLRKPDGASDIVKAPWKIAMLQKMEQPVFFDFTNTGFRDGLNELGELANITIVFNRRLFTDGGVDPDAPIQMVANGMSFKNALKWILANVNAEYSLYQQAVYITPRGSVTGDTIMQTYSILDLITPPKSFYGPDIQPGQTASITDPLDTPEDETRLDENNIKELIMEKIAKDTWDDARGTSIEIFQGKLIIVHNEETQEQIANFLTELREAQTLQVVIQTRFIDVKEGTLEEIGVDWRGLDQAGVTDIGSLGTQGAGYLSDVRRLDDYDARGVISNPSNADQFTRTFSTQVPSTSGAGLLGQFAILGNIQAQAVFHAVENSGEGIELQAPSVTVFNNTTAHIDVAVSTNYVRDYQVVDGNYDPTIDQFFQGVVLEVKPTVSSDRKYITMEVKPTIATLLQLSNFTFNALGAIGVAGGNPGPNNGNANAPIILTSLALTIQVPNIRYERLRTTVNLPDRSVVLLGGLMRSLKGDVQTGVPLLSNIPFLGRLFKNKSSGQSKDNLIISMSGRIVIFEEIENEL